MSNHTPDVNASTRIAIAALLHDLGKFSERARLFDEPSYASALDAHRTQFCPFYAETGRHTHIHAAYTGMSFDLLEQAKDKDQQPVWPNLTKDQAAAYPFVSRQHNRDGQLTQENRATSDDSLVSASAMHHKPSTFLQWIIATADRVASGFEREAFEDYNQEKGEQLDHYRARLWSLLEQIKQTGKHDARYALEAYSPASVMPTGKDADSKEQGQQAYKALWDAFMQGLSRIPASHRHHLPLWLDHFDSLWLTYTHAIPSSTFKSKVDVSLYDHSKTVAAIAVALWQYYASQPGYNDPAQQQQWANDLKQRNNFNDQQLLLIQGDFAGIQDFLFANGGESTKKAAKLLRGRSFYVSLLCELASLKVLDSLGLPSTSQIINAAGKFMIVAAATPNTVQQLQKVEAELSAWFLEHSLGEAAIVLAVRPTSCNDLLGGEFKQLMSDLFSELEAAKLKRFNLTQFTPQQSIFSESLSAYNNELGVCKITGKQPATLHYDGIAMCALARDQIVCGKHLANPKRQRIMITTEAVDVSAEDALSVPVFGYYVTFTNQQGEWSESGKLTDGTGKFGELARAGKIQRFWDISLPTDANTPLWNGYARRYINAYVPTWAEKDKSNADWGKYKKLSAEDQPIDVDFAQGIPKTFNHLACENRSLIHNEQKWLGQTALITLKGDIDNLGSLFQSGMETPSFAKMATLSRQINAFFAVYLPWLCKQHYPNTYTVFAGGDDFFIIGPWRDTIRLAQRMQKEFAAYASHNPHIHFSAGMVMSKPGLPLHTLAEQAESALEQSKSIKDGKKNAVTLWQHTLHWSALDQLLSASQLLDELYKEHNISMGYRYGLLSLADKATSNKPEDAIWRAHLAYRTQRYVIDKLKGKSDEQKQLVYQQLTQHLYNGLNEHQQSFKVALFDHLYQYRD